ncbi:hypothetical protein [Brachybacterium sp. YJGR34]|uniref:hypothetical protein n=1 Tax=Brachybacterium sp. YJGR34 TaxID=2059911 RepID=UPI000E0A7534|nr:hypothetical protein [Brachybacterium sp. YJGR34]
MTVPPPSNVPDPSGIPPGTDLSSDLGAALRFAGTGLLRSPVPFLVAGLVYSVVMLLVIGGGVAVAMVVLFSRLQESGALDASETVPWTEMLLFYAVTAAIALLAVPFTILWQSGSARAAETLLEGRRPGIGQAMIGPGRVLLTALLVLVIVGVGLLLCYLPGLVAGVLLMYAIPAAARGASPLAALAESVALARANLGTTIVAWLLIGVASSIASAVVVGLVVAIPFIVLFEVGMYERLNGRHLPEPAAA